VLAPEKMIAWPSAPRPNEREFIVPAARSAGDRAPDWARGYRQCRGGPQRETRPDFRLRLRVSDLRLARRAGAAADRHSLSARQLVGTRVAIIADGGLRAVGTLQEVVTAEMLSAIYRTEVIVEDTPSGRRVCVPAWGDHRRPG